ncbi:MAG: hypothetical protein ABR517_10840 [Thermoanaerobaculia bacterium]
MAIRTTLLFLFLALVSSALSAAEGAAATASVPAAVLEAPRATVPEDSDWAASLVSDPRVLAFFDDLFLRAGVGSRNEERAAFLTIENGRFGCLLWPASRDFRRETFQGIIPKGTVAIVHTHPSHITPASLQDRATAKQTGLPLFTVTRSNISLIDPSTGAETWPVRRTFWRERAIPAGSSERTSCREIGTPDRSSLPGGLLAQNER